jgi:hypothetical protein
MGSSAWQLRQLIDHRFPACRPDKSLLWSAVEPLTSGRVGYGALAVPWEGALFYIRSLAHHPMIPLLILVGLIVITAF